MIPSPVESSHVGPYRLLRLLSAGGQAEVFLAEDPRLGRRVALKVFDLGGDDRAAARLEREARALAKVEHPAICPVYEVGDDKGCRFLAMKYVDGETLATVIGRARAGGSVLGEREIASLFAALARGLQAAHDAGLVHRDVTPANVMVAAGGRPVLIDFGLTADDDDPALLTRTGDALGTPAYLAPEQLGETRRVDHRADVFSLGACLYEALTLERPFVGATREALQHAILFDEPRPPGQGAGRMARELAAIAFRALEKVPARRYATAAEMAEDLEAARDGGHVSARPPTALSLLARRARRRPGWTAAGGAALLVLAALLAAGGFWIGARDEVLRGEHEARYRELSSWLETAFLELGEGSTVRAAEAFERVLSTDDAPDVAVIGLAVAALELGRAADAWAALERLGPSEAGRGVHALRAEALRRLGREPPPGDVDELASNALDAFALGLNAMRRGHRGDAAAFAEAQEEFERAIFLSRTPLPYHYLELAHAAAHADDAPLAVEAADVLVRRWPDWPSARFRAGVAHAEADPLRALDDLRRARELAPRSVPILTNLGATLARAGRMAEARPLLEEAREAAPSDPFVTFNLGKVHDALGDPGGANELLEATLLLDPAFEPARHLLVFRRFAEGRTDEALAHLDAGAERAPDAARADVFRVRAALARGERDAAREALDRVRTSPPRTPSSLQPLAQDLLRHGQTEEAAEVCRWLVEATPRSSAAWLLLCDAEANCGRVDRALAAARRAADLAPHDASVLFKFGAVLQYVDQPEEAAAVLRAAVARAEQPEFLCNLGLALRSLGRLREAVETLERAHEIGTARPRWPFPSAQWLAQAKEDRERQLAALAAASPAEGASLPSSAEAFDLVRAAESEGDWRRAADGFAALLASGDTLEVPPSARSAAIRAAARAFAEDGEVQFAMRALGWLERDLEERRAVASPGLPWLLAWWQEDPALAAIRDEALGGRARRVWEGVQALRRESTRGGPP